MTHDNIDILVISAPSANHQCNMKLKTIKEIKNFKNKKVLLRVDFNVPVKNGRVLEDFRIKSGLPTIKYLTEHGAAVIILNHLGRPQGKFVAALSNKPIAQKLSKLLKQPVKFINKVAGSQVQSAVDNLASGEVVMLENVRFHPGEEKNDQTLAKEWSKCAEIFVNDAFAVSHRAASSTSAIAAYLPSFAGLLLETEVNHLSRILESKVRPKIAIIGGAKLDTKIAVIKNLLTKMDKVLLGGAIANNFLKAKGLEVGKSLVDDALLGAAKKMLGNKLILPVDVIVADEISPSAKPVAKTIDRINQTDIILDLGPQTVQLYFESIKKSKLIVWNGPLGYFELPQFKKASSLIAKAVSLSKAESVIGGGETIQLIQNSKLKTCPEGKRGIQNSYLSTGGGAMLEFLSGKILPGIKPLIRP